MRLEFGVVEVPTYLAVQSVAASIEIVKDRLGLEEGKMLAAEPDDEASLVAMPAHLL